MIASERQAMHPMTSILAASSEFVEGKLNETAL
jgi:hypothetical protein